MKNSTVSLLKTGDAKFGGIVDFGVQFAMKNQIKDEKLWAKFVDVFRSEIDLHDNGWRCEYWGKMMRGACLTYRYCADEELYQILEHSVRDMLTTQDSYGRYSTYPVDDEFRGWDMWGRKYVLTAMLHFYEICKDERLKQDILSSMQRHADYILSKIGAGEGKRCILTTSYIYGGLNSATITEPMLALYKVTGEKRYLEFAQYILATGGTSTGNLLEIATENKKKPYQYPETKAYEMMSFFEGALAYYEMTGEEYYLNAVQNFVNAVKQSEITVIGCAGCTHELFDNSAVKQTEKGEYVMQETCVTVTWIRLLARLYNITADAWIADEIERSAINALYGSMNTNGLKMYHEPTGEYLESMPFDSYGALYYSRRNIMVGGLKDLEDGTYYGCCACIASAGIALVPLYAVVRRGDEIIVNGYYEGEVLAQTENGAVRLQMSGGYFSNGKCKITVRVENKQVLALKLRVPSWSERADIVIGGERVQAGVGYYCVEREFTDGESIELDFHATLKAHYLNGKVCFSYGGFVLARDSAKEGKDIVGGVVAQETFEFEKLALADGESVRLCVELGGEKVLLTDYASCNKNWANKSDMMTVWMDIIP